MKVCTVAILLASCAMGTCVIDSSAAKLEFPVALTVQASPQRSELAAAVTSTVGEIVIGGAEIVFAELRFEGSLTPNTEVELWPVGSDGETPDESFGRNIWTMEERTGNLARFDITSLAKAWSSGDYPNHGLLIVVIEPDELTEAMLSSGAPTLPQNGSIIIYTRPAEPIKPEEPSKRDRTVPRPEDGSGKED